MIVFGVSFVGFIEGVGGLENLHRRHALEVQLKLVTELIFDAETVEISERAIVKPFSLDFNSIMLLN